MKNKVELKKFLNISIFVILIFLCFEVIIGAFEYKFYNRNYNEKVYSIVDAVKKRYPKITEEEIIEIIENAGENDDLLKKYGYLEDDALICNNEKIYHGFLLINLLVIIVISGLLILINLKYDKRKDKDIKEIQNYVEQINKGNYKLKIDNNTEDELSILKNEVYKTMMNLKETKDISLKDKENLKISLEDISHQLKTPLTSIMINLDNLEDIQDRDDETRKKIIKQIKKDIAIINFLIQSILKLSRLDTNTVEFIKKDVYLETLIDKAISNVSALCDLKNIKIDKNKIVNTKIKCDEFWQIDAITNILKNAVEHAKNFVKIDTLQNNLYTEIDIINDGDRISSKDLPHIFERFYRGENAKNDSIGIGLSLSKKIIDNSNGNISVKINENYTTFMIKYY